MKSCNLLLLFVLFFISLTLSAQNRTQLELERMQVIKSIEATDSLIEVSESYRQIGLNKLSALRGQISQRNALLKNIKNSILAAELEMESNQLSLDHLTNKIQIIEDQYAMILSSKYVRTLTGSKWIAILSASNFNEAFLRWNYYRQFDAYRESKIDELSYINDVVALKNQEIKKYALENSALIQLQQQQNSELQTRIGQQNELVKDLQKDKTILQSQLLAIKDARESLNQAIESRVLGELSGAKVGSDNSMSSDEDAAIVKGNVLLPITIGYIEDISIDNAPKSKTVSIYAAKGASVISIADGKVISVKSVTGYGKMIILQHDIYYSVYANMSDVIVKVGDRIEKSSKLGGVDKEKNKLHFELWKDKERLDANEWLED